MARDAPGAARVSPFYCPYCGEQDIRPDDEHGLWICALCARRWALSYRGTLPERNGR